MPYQEMIKHPRAPFVSVLIEKLVVSELVRKFTFFHGTCSWL